MAKEKKQKITHYKFYGFNITLQSGQRKGDEAYIELVKTIYDKEVLINIGAERSMLLRNQFSSQYKFGDKTHTILYGKIVRFTVIDAHNWYNKTKKDFENHEMPKDVFPNGFETDYVFLPSVHRFFIKITQKIAANSVQYFLSSALDQVINNNEQIFVNVMQSQDEINQIINSAKITNLTVNVSYTNDDIGPEYKEFMDRLFKESHTGNFVGNFKPDETGKLENKSTLITGLLELVKDNGEATANAEINGRRKIISTRDYPEKIDIPSESEESVKIKLLEKLILENRPDDIKPIKEKGKRRKKGRKNKK